MRRHFPLARVAVFTVCVSCLSTTPLFATEWYVARGGVGHGTAAAPFGTIQQGLLVYNTATAFRYENDIQNTRLYDVTIGRQVTRVFRAASSKHSVLDVRNLLLLGASLPAQATGGSNLAVSASAFVDATRHDYRLASGSPAIDSGETIAGVTHDRRGTPRPQGLGFDIGAYERPVEPTHAWGITALPRHARR